MDRWLHKVIDRDPSASSSQQSTKNNETTESCSGSSKGDSLQTIQSRDVQSSQKSGKLEFSEREIRHVVLDSYPKRDSRNFRSQWFDQFPWLEYDQKQDAAFCFICRVYGVNESKEDAFTTTGFSNWKKALEKGRGFHQYEKTQAHLMNVSKQVEHQNRQRKLKKCLCW